MIQVVWYLEGHWTCSGLIPYDPISNQQCTRRVPRVWRTQGQPVRHVGVLSKSCGPDPRRGSAATGCRSNCSKIQDTVQIPFQLQDPRTTSCAFRSCGATTLTSRVSERTLSCPDPRSQIQQVRSSDPTKCHCSRTLFMEPRDRVLLSFPSDRLCGAGTL